MVHWVKPAFVTSGFLSVSVGIPTALLPVRLSANANVPGKAEDAGPSPWTPACPVGDEDELPGSWIHYVSGR